MIVILLINTVLILSQILGYAILARVLFSWFKAARPGAPVSRVEQILNDITDPLFNLARKIPHKAGMIDFSPIIALLGLQLFTQLLINILNSLGL